MRQPLAHHGRHPNTRMVRPLVPCRSRVHSGRCTKNCRKTEGKPFLHVHPRADGRSRVHHLHLASASRRGRLLRTPNRDCDGCNRHWTICHRRSHEYRVCSFRCSWRTGASRLWARTRFPWASSARSRATPSISLLRKAGASFWLSAGFAGFVGDMLTYATTALQLALSLHPEAVSSNWALFTAEFSVVQIPISILEFAFTAATIQYITTHRPEMLTWWRKVTPIPIGPAMQHEEPAQTKRKGRLDKFNKYALVTMFAIVVGMLVSTYVGYSIYGSSIFETRYITVIEDQARNLGLAFGHIIELGAMGEYVGFTITGCAAGLVIGYLFLSVFGPRRNK